MNRARPHRSERGLPCRSDRGRHRSDHHRERVDGRIGLALQVRAARLVAHARVPRPVLIGLGHGTTVRVARADTTSGLCGRPPRWPTRVSFHSAQAPTQVSSGQSHMLVAVNRAEQTSARRSARSPGQEPAAHRWWPTVLPPTATARSNPLRQLSGLQSGRRESRSTRKQAVSRLDQTDESMSHDWKQSRHATFDRRSRLCAAPATGPALNLNCATTDR
jgi:hypothetical protein